MLDAAAAAARELGPHDVAIVLGSGWTEAVSSFEQHGDDVPVATLPGFAQPTVAGHCAVVRSLRERLERVERTTEFDEERYRSLKALVEGSRQLWSDALLSVDHGDRVVCVRAVSDCVDRPGFEDGVYDWKSLAT